MTNYSFLPLRNSLQWARVFSLSRLHDHTQTHHTRQNSGRVISPTRRPLPDSTQHLQVTDIHALGGIGIPITASDRPQTTPWTARLLGSAMNQMASLLIQSQQLMTMLDDLWLVTYFQRALAAPTLCFLPPKAKIFLPPPPPPYLPSICLGVYRHFSALRSIFFVHLNTLKNRVQQICSQ